jgi:arylsulfatase
MARIPAIGETTVDPHPESARRRANSDLSPQAGFDAGWDAYREQVFAKQKELGILPANTNLSRHDPDVQDWNKLSADERRLYARMMEVFAGYLEHTDHHIGELIAFLKEMGEYDNTLIMVVSDNGASAEGGPNGSVNEG